MSEALTTLVQNIRPYVPGCPDFAILPEVIRAYIDFCRQTHFLTKDFTVQVVTSDPDSYKNDRIIIYTSTVISGYRPIFLKRLFVDTAEYKPEFVDVLTDATYLTSTTLPAGSKFYTFPNNQSIEIFPFTDLESTVELYLSVAFQPHTDVTTMPDIIYDEWHETIESGALSKLLKIPGKSWTDRAEAKARRIEFGRGVIDAKVQGNLKKNGGQVTVKMRPFV